jgi:hypothetical protein
MTRVHVWMVLAALAATVTAGVQGCAGAPSGSSVGPSDKPVLTLKGASR